MRKPKLVKPTDLHAPGALAELFAYNRALYGGWTMEDPPAPPAPPAPTPPAPPAPPAPAPAPAPPADLGFPENVPVAEMTADQRTAYDKHMREKNRETQRQWKAVTGDRTPAQLKAELDRLAELEKAQMTASDRAIAEAKEAGATEARTAERTVTATTIYEAALETLGIPETEIPELIRGFNAAAFVTDTGVDRAAITTFAKRVAPAGTAEQRRRDFGGGNRNLGNGAAGAAGKAEAAKRFGTKTQTGA